MSIAIDETIAFGALHLGLDQLWIETVYLSYITSRRCRTCRRSLREGSSVIRELNELNTPRSPCKTYKIDAGESRSPIGDRCMITPICTLMRGIQ